MTKPYHPIGTIIHGTMRSEDLIPAFCEALTLAKDNYDWQGMTDRGNAYAEYSQLIIDAENHDPANDSFMDIIEELCAALNDFAPPYSYFGAFEGDGSDYGFWPYYDSDSLQDARDSGYHVEISDHGNVSLYDSNDVEIWGVV